MALKTCPKCAAKHGPRKKMCDCGHCFLDPLDPRTHSHPLYPEPGAAVCDTYHGLPQMEPPGPLPKDGLLTSRALRDEYVAYEGLGFCVYHYIPAERIFASGLRQKWARARAAMQAIVEYLDATKEEQLMQDKLEELRKVADEVLDSIVEKRGEARDAAVSTMRNRGLLREVLKNLRFSCQTAVAITTAKEACEELAEVATKAGENGDREFSDYLRGQLDRLAAVVASLLPYVQEEPDGKAA